MALTLLAYALLRLSTKFQDGGLPRGKEADHFGSHRRSRLHLTDNESIVLGIWMGMMDRVGEDIRKMTSQTAPL